MHERLLSAQDCSREDRQLQNRKGACATPATNAARILIFWNDAGTSRWPILSYGRPVRQRILPAKDSCCYPGLSLSIDTGRLLRPGSCGSGQWREWVSSLS